MKAKRYDELTFADDFIFCKVLENNEGICKKILELVLNVKIRKVVCLNHQKTIEITSDGKGIRLDVYLEDDDNTIYNIEMQTTTQKFLPKRSRYYQGMVDLNTIQRGDSYEKLKKTYIIFICLHDPFGENLPIYRFHNTCRELPELSLGDETEKVFINAAYSFNEGPEELNAFIKYIRTGAVSTSFVQMLDKEVERIKNHEEWRNEYMTLLMRDAEKKEEGRREGVLNSIFSMYASGMVSKENAMKAFELNHLNPAEFDTLYQQWQEEK